MKCKKCGTDTWVGVETSLCDKCKPIHEEGQYQNKCVDCGKFFFGHKRQIVCEACKNNSSVSPLTKEQQAILKDTRELLQVARFNDIPAVAVGVAEKLVVLIDNLQARAHRETAELDKELPQEMLGVRFDAKLSDAWDSELDSYELSCYFAERARRAESRAQKQYTEQEPLSSAEVEKLWEKLRYSGSNNSYLYFHELDRNGLLNSAAVRSFIEKEKQ